MECGERELFVQAVHGWGNASFSLRGHEAPADMRSFRPMARSNVPQRPSHSGPTAQHLGRHGFRAGVDTFRIWCYSCGVEGHRKSECPAMLNKPNSEPFYSSNK